MKPALLFLCHRIPYPPNKGDKIRSYNLLRYLAERYSVFLGTFIDEPSDWRYTSKVEELCQECCFVDLNPQLARIKSVSGLLSGKPLSIPYYYNGDLDRWIRSRVRDKDIKLCMVYSSAMAQYVLGSDLGFRNRVIDFVDIDSDKWRQYAEKKGWPMSRIYRREADHLFEFEKKVASSFDASLFVSSAEAELFQRISGNPGEKIDYYSNGVDVDYFDPGKNHKYPYVMGERALVFTGAMDYWPNVDAVRWFGQEIFPEILKDEPEARFYIVGGNPAESVCKLQQQPGIVVTGRVDDVRPYIRHAEVVVAPMRIARGIQNKVLEGMAMGRPTVVTPQGLEGIDAEDGKEVLVASDISSFVEKTMSIFAGDWEELGSEARNLICGSYTWDNTLPKLDQWLPVEP